MVDLFSGDDDSSVVKGGKAKRIGRYMKLGRFAGQSMWKLMQQLSVSFLFSLLRYYLVVLSSEEREH